MLNSLKLCPRCSRHLKPSETRCPFCSRSLGELAGFGSAVLAAALVSGCGASTAPAPAYGPPPLGPDTLVVTKPETPPVDSQATDAGSQQIATDVPAVTAYAPPPTTSAAPKQEKPRPQPSVVPLYGPPPQ